MSVEKFIVLDVEGASYLRPYNIGYIIADRNGKIYKKHSFALPQFLWENISGALKTNICVDMMKQNAQEILADCGNKKAQRKYKQVSLNEFYNLFTKEIQDYNIKRMFSYNVTFDKNSLKRLLGDKFDTIDLIYCDIITGILYTKLMTQKYVKFCVENGFITDKGNIMTKAEVVYKYLTQNLNFEEEHTGLADTLIEYEILLSVFKTHKKTNFEPCQAWKSLKKFCDEKNIAI